MPATESISNPPSLDDYLALPRPESSKGGLRVEEAAASSRPREPLVSIVTVVRNGLMTLPRTLDSVLSQDFPQIEHVIVDGGSTDGTLDLLRANQHRIDLWISETDRGISDAFNKGIALARGEIVGLLNSDDWYEPGAIRAVVTAMQTSGADISCGRLQYWDANRRTYLVTSDPALLARGMSVGHPTVFVRRDCYRKYGLFRLDFRVAMDYEWLIRASTAGARFAAIDRCIANMQGGGVGDRRWRDSQREVARARSLHVGGAAGTIAYHSFVARRIFIGSVRRVLDAMGLGMLRRAYHRWFSPITITADQHDDPR